MSLELALRAGIPLISVTTRDIIHLDAVMDEFCGKGAVKRYDLTAKNMRHALPEESILCVVPNAGPISWDIVYVNAVRAKSVIIIVNPPQPQPEFYDAGALPTPRSMIYEFLSENNISEKAARNLIPALGGLSIKEITDVLMLTQARDGSTTSAGIIKTRQMYMNRTQGLEIVNTDDLRGYVPHRAVQSFAKSEKHFFLSDTDERLRPRGLLAYGTPGTGKSMAAKYLAQAWGVPLFRMDATFQSKWIGESESNLIAALRHVEAEAPAILLFDEVEKMFSSANDAGTTQKLLGSLLWWLQEHRSRVFTFMTCNRLRRVPAELYRPGRIDRCIQFKELKKDEAISMGFIFAKTFKQDTALADVRALVEAYMADNEVQTITPSKVGNMVTKFVKGQIRGEA